MEGAKPKNHKSGLVGYEQKQIEGLNENKSGGEMTAKSIPIAKKPSEESIPDEVSQFTKIDEMIEENNPNSYIGSEIEE